MQEFPVELVRGGRALPPNGQKPREEAEWGEDSDGEENRKVVQKKGGMQEGKD